MAITSFAVRLGGDIPDRQISQLIRELEGDLSRAGIPAAIESTRGMDLYPSIALDLVTSDSINILIEHFKAYLFRERLLTISVMCNSKRLELTTENLKIPAVQSALRAMASPSSD